MDTNNMNGRDIKIAYEDLCAIIAFLKIMGACICEKKDISDDKLQVIARTAVGLAVVVKNAFNLEAEDIAKYGEIHCGIVARVWQMGN